ncbi:LOW QUALITY PROTEIN: hypothetical protein PoB_002264900 [Plakobranchus ocellatus]|uniref:Uncharacterized protein n=1 Tax=Plakobranchus ocellatus TaxID=259542 RepID=A0AAV3ZQJ2_9GAST|nr:LOW QUALITY PROTEIN: hypothetical protein PoB_002264900 [Plakobranchus ocellatus]
MNRNLSKQLKQARHSRFCSRFRHVLHSRLSSEANFSCTCVVLASPTFLCRAPFSSTLKFSSTCYRLHRSSRAPALSSPSKFSSTCVVVSIKVLKHVCCRLHQSSRARVLSSPSKFSSTCVVVSTKVLEHVCYRLYQSSRARVLSPSKFSSTCVIISIEVLEHVCYRLHQSSRARVLSPSKFSKFSSSCVIISIKVLEHVCYRLHRSSRAPRPQQGDLRLSGPPSGQGADDGARTPDRRFPADLRADSLATVNHELKNLRRPSIVLS